MRNRSLVYGGKKGRRVVCVEERQYVQARRQARRGPREKNHILNQINAMFVQVRAAVNQINNHMYT